MRGMSELPLKNRAILITGSAKRIGAALARACAKAGANIVVHYHRSEQDAAEIKDEIESMGRKAWLIGADLGEPAQVASLMRRSAEASPLYGLVNSAAIFEPLTMQTTTREAWEGTS